MQFIYMLSILAGFALADNSQVCKKHPSVAQAVRGICAHKNLVVPSNDAMKGATSSDSAAFVQIVGTCNPAQWVPQQYCYQQFGDMCFRSVTTQKYGRNKCQTWKINVAHGSKDNGIGGKAGT